MNQKMKNLFAKLAKAIEAHQFGLSEVFDTIAQFSESDPGIAFALSSHMRDFLAERAVTGEVISYSALMTEAYRRAFFDHAQADKYGTGHIARHAGIEALAASLIYGLTNDATERQLDHLVATANIDTAATAH